MNWIKKIWEKMLMAFGFNVSSGVAGVAPVTVVSSDSLPGLVVDSFYVEDQGSVTRSYPSFPGTSLFVTTNTTTTGWALPTVTVNNSTKTVTVNNPRITAGAAPAPQIIVLVIGV